MSIEPQALWLLNGVLAFMVFAVALHIERAEIDALKDHPRAAFIGLSAQWLVLPALTIALIVALPISTPVALALLLVAACPGGSISNFYTLLAKGNVVLSLGLSTASTLAAVVVTPAIMTLGGRALPELAISAGASVSVAAMLELVAIVILLPLLLGGGLRYFRPAWAFRIRRAIRLAATALLFAFIAVLLVKNVHLLRLQLLELQAIVLLHNGLALAAGFGLATLARLPDAQRRTITLETGLQNAGLGLVLALNLFAQSPDIGTISIVVAWWGVWHLMSGGMLALWWARRAPLRPASTAVSS